MRNAVILHGTSDSPGSYWIPWLKAELQKKGYEVWAPQLPGANQPSLEAQLPFVLEGGRFDEETVLIGHSAGCPLILSALEAIEAPVRQAVLVAGYCAPLPHGGSILQPAYDWEKIRSRCQDFVFINSDDDPWGCDDKQGRIMFDRLGGTQVILHGEGHMGSSRFNQPYKEFPLLLKLID